MIDIGADLRKAYDDGYKCGRLDALAELLKYIGEMGDYDGERKTEPQTSKIIEAYAKGFEDGAEAVKAMPQTERSE